jgi:putative DNA primase/helicase
MSYHTENHQLNQQVTNITLTPQSANSSYIALENVDQSDVGNVARLHQITQGDIRYVIEMRAWIWWNGTRWEYDRGLVNLHRLTLEVAQTYVDKRNRLQREMEEPSTSPDQRKALKLAIRSLDKWIAECRNRSRLEAMIALAQKDQRFVISSTELDRHPELIGVGNGVVCLRSGTLRADSKADFILRRSPVNFNPAASIDGIQKFIEEITAYPDGIEDGKVKARPRPVLTTYLKKVCGYTLTGLSREQLMFMLCGGGANGKSLLVDLLREVLGDYCEVVQPEIILSAKTGSSAEQASPSTRKLAGARCAITSESKDGAQLDVAVVKRHTGDSKMTARGLHESPVTFDVTHKLILLTNHPPRVDHMDDAIKGRLHVIPFDMRWNRPGTVDPDPSLPDADKHLLSKLRAESEGILKFFIEGAVMYFAEGLAPPHEVATFTQGYISAQDTVKRWMTEQCEVCPDEVGATAGQLFANYRGFCATEGEREQDESAAALGRRLKRMGLHARKTRLGSRYGLRLKKTVCAEDEIPSVPPEDLCV